MSLVPFALQLYEEYQAGRTAEELSALTGVPLDRIEQRLRAAQRFLECAQRAAPGRAAKHLTA